MDYGSPGQRQLTVFKEITVFLNTCDKHCDQRALHKARGLVCLHVPIMFFLSCTLELLYSASWFGSVRSDTTVIWLLPLSPQGTSRWQSWASVRQQQRPTRACTARTWAPRPAATRQAWAQMPTRTQRRPCPRSALWNCGLAELASPAAARARQAGRTPL